MQDQQRKILDMLADGRLTPNEADAQLEALRRTAEQPVIDVPSPGFSRTEGLRRQWEGLRARWARPENRGAVIMVAPMLVLIVMSALTLFLAVAVGLMVVLMAIPAWLILVGWNGILVSEMGLPRIGYLEAYGLAFLVLLLWQGVSRWRR